MNEPKIVEQTQISTQPPPLTNSKGSQQILTCPVCKTTVPNGQTTCPECHEDLSLLFLTDNLAPLFYNEGLRLAKQEQFDQAIERLQASLVFDPDQVASLVVLGKIYARQKHYDQAIAYWQRALKIEPGNSKARAGLKKAQDLRQQSSIPRTIIKYRMSPRWIIDGMVLITVAFLAGNFVSLLWQPAKLPATTPNLVPPTTLPTPLPPTAFPDKTGAVQQALQANKDVTALKLEVRQEGQVIYLNGTVPQPELKTQAEAIVKKAVNAGPVDSSGLIIKPLPLVENVQQAFLNDPGLAFFNLKVEQVDSAIRLVGQVTSAELKERAVKMAGEVVGVELVDVRDLTVVPADLDQAVQQKLATTPQLAGQDITVEQIGQNILLKGSVSAADIKTVAENLAGEVEGVELVDGRALVIISPQLAEAVQQALRADTRTTGWKIEVKQLDQGVLLKGIVPNRETEHLIESTARGVRGVEWVDTSGIQIEAPKIEYIVQVGDSLASIAQKFYGDENRWPAIYEANREVVNRPGQLRIGTSLIIP